jgi:hypothetical protein
VYQAVTHFVPPKFPILLIVPAILVDLLWTNTRAWKPWLVALVTGPVFVLSLACVEWPFADFLMSKEAANRFFGTGYFQYNMPSASPDVLRHFVDPQQGLALWSGIGLAMLYAALSAWAGIALGRWMRDIQR